MINGIQYGKHTLTNEDIEAVVQSLKSEYLTQGPKVSEFEDKFSKYVGAKYAVAVNNGTAALHLCSLALGVKKGVRVITSPITFVASANCVRYCGGEIWFADIDPATYTLDIKKVRELIESKPKGFFHGIIPVQFAGYVTDMLAFRSLAEEYNLWIIEDGCHAPGGYFINANGIRHNCGNGLFADLAIFSFHPVKHIACGEGGMITTNDVQLYNNLMLLRTHGITKQVEHIDDNHGGWYYEMQELGYNYRLTDFQAALGISQLDRAQKGLIRRREIAKFYFDSFKGKSFIMGQSGFLEGHAYHLYVIEVERRRELYDFLKSKNIFCQVHYIPIYLHPYYRQIGYSHVSFPSAESYYSRCLSLPMYPGLSDSEQKFVIESVNSFYE